MNESSSPLVGIFADDLTGALDAAAPFAGRGFRTVVSPTFDLPTGANSAEIISVNIGSRHLEPSAIAVRTEAAVKLLVGLGVKTLINKVDSTLRGNPGVELVAALNALDGDHAVLCPAYPQNGRTVVNGVLLVDGVPVAETDIGQDQLSPLSSSRVGEIVGTSLERADLASSAHIRGPDGGVGVTDLLPVIITLDARTEDDLHALAQRLLSAESTALVAGSAGISVAVADEMSVGRLPFKRLTSEVGVHGRRVLIVTASQREIVDQQIDVLGSHIPLVHAELSVDEVMSGVAGESVEAIIEAADHDGIVVLKLAKLGANGGLDNKQLRSVAQTFVRNLGHVARMVTDAINPDTMIVIGGDTASGVLEACGVNSLELRGELQPGTVSGVPVDGSIAGRLLITRAGGFGDENALFDLVTLLEFGHNV